MSDVLVGEPTPGMPTCLTCGAGMCRHTWEALLAAEARAAKLEGVAEALLMFYRVAYWDEEASERWFLLTGSGDATTKVLCDFARLALAPPPSAAPERKP